MDAYSKMVNSGVATPNEIRRKEGLKSLEGGDSIFLQRQMTPVDLISRLNAAELQNAVAPAPVEVEVSQPANEIDQNIAREIAISAIKKAMRSD
jgi:hypothetical protein